MPVFTFFARICCTALHDGHGEENSVQQEKHRAQLMSRIHRHPAVPMPVIFEKERIAKNIYRERDDAKFKQTSREAKHEEPVLNSFRHTAPRRCSGPNPCFVKGFSSYFVNKPSVEGGGRGGGKRKEALLPQVLMPHLLPSHAHSAAGVQAGLRLD